jgi:hypothetical protein
MNGIIRFKKVFLLFGLIINPFLLQAQNISQFKYINPLPNSSFVSINSNIVIRQGNKLDKTSINYNLINAVGTKSGLHTGKIILANDSRTLVFTPSSSFQTDEVVTVTFNDGLKTSDGQKIGGLLFKFHTCLNPNTPVQEAVTHVSKSAKIKPKPGVLSVPDSTLPADMPPIVINQSDNPSPGYFFLEASPYIEIVDNKGTPVFYQNAGGDVYDFDLQPNGELTYFVYPVDCYGLDSAFNNVQTFNTVNGYSPDVHDLRVLPDGNHYIFGKRNVTMDMSRVVNGGNPNADIIVGALQEFDSQGNLLFQWDALDHYKITDVDSEIDLTQATIDFTHFNAVEIDTDGNLLISARNLDEITKVDHNTGDIIWRWGGNNNQFTFMNDDLGFSRQHDIRRFSDGDISIFDNGVNHASMISSAVDYKLDEINKTATLVSRFYHEDIYTETEGSVQELPNGNRVICWGQNSSPFLTEITSADSIAYDLSYQYYVDSYRGFKYQWKTNLFTTNTDSLKFGRFITGQPITKQFTVYNFHNIAVTINELYCSNPAISTSISLPVTILPDDSLIIPVTFNPTLDTSFSVSFNIRHVDVNNGVLKMVARQVILSGTVQGLSSVNNIALPRQYELEQNYPNPFNPSTIIKYAIPKSGLVTLKIYDILGKEVKTLVNEFKSNGEYSINFNADKLSSGVYFYQLISGDYNSIKKMILLK